MNDSDHGDEIVRLEAQIDELAARIESCRKFILAGRIAVVGGSVVLVAMVIGAIRFDPSVMVGAVAAVLAGIVRARTAARRKKRCMNWPPLRQSERHSSGRSIFGLFPTATADNERFATLGAARGKISWRKILPRQSSG